MWEILHFLVIHKLVTYSASLRKGVSSISRDFLSVSSAKVVVSFVVVVG